MCEREKKGEMERYTRKVKEAKGEKMKDKKTGKMKTEKRKMRLIN